MDTLTGADPGAAGAEHPEPGAPRPPRDDDLRQAVVVFMAQRPHLLATVRRILGSASEAEDVVQETWLRWQRTDRRTVANPPAFLATAATRLAINTIQSARSRREAPSTPWLDDVALPAGDAESTAERAEAVELALRVVLERLTPAERAAYVLRTGFDYPYADIASALRRSAPNARQLVSRAHTRILSGAGRPVSAGAHRQLVGAFTAAARNGEFTRLEALLTAPVRPAAV
ncbi:sigma-70 family RNA polymerase sigma factor [Blastococcus haudaquaticus]|uniref:RNA polymerase sigma factor, sigma-70 family n=1 Tax=Blastococcus haudaquaticus TaxID=1938745 RepID=A0A286GTI9_9ACTN|nr:sigma-70 family RNA polymerase sigma factor [Blastococcus haudaquaticus]SOD98752.1 RNA polymerase sigma factor, sigma-70 family [Blastococcus haudaquaticus]